MKRVEFIYDTHVHGGSKIYREVRMVDEDTPLRMEAFEIVKNAYDKGDDIVNFNLQSRDTKIGIDITTKENGLQSDYDKRFYFDKKGEVHFLEFQELLHYDWTISELDFLNKNDFLEGNTSKIYLYIPGGLGSGPEFDIVGQITEHLFTVLSQVSVEMLAAYALKKGIGMIKNKIKYDDIQKVVKRWVKNNGVRESKQIREFISQKGNWKTEELQKTLRVSEELAVILLLSLGFELKENNWVRSDSESALNKRNEWFEDYEKLYK